MTGAPTFADFPLDTGETMADALESALRYCSGAEPGLSVLFIRAEQSVPVMRELADALDRCRAIIKFHVRDSGVCCTLAGSDTPFSALEAFRDAVVALAKARGETPNDCGDSRHG